MEKEIFINDKFLLETIAAERLYHEFVSDLPIIDYHNHLNPKEIAENKIFSSISEVWLKGDHYKWRAMRANAIPEEYITGKTPDEVRFMKWAETVPYTLCNPLYHWTHLELKRYFDVDELLDKNSSRHIYERINMQIQTKDFSVQELIKKMKVQVICTTDEPTDTLEYHQQLQHNNFCKVLPTFRPDKFINIPNPDYLTILQKLEESTNISIESFNVLVEALEKRIDIFHKIGGRLSDHGLSQLYAINYTEVEIEAIFKKRISKQSLTAEDAQKFQTALLFQLAKKYHQKKWTMQLHLGALRDNNQRLSNLLGNDVGCDSIGDYKQAEGLSYLLKSLDSISCLPKTILYNLNPADNEVFATMAGNFNDDSIAGKVQWGSAWWFLDQKDGMEKQLNTLSNMGLISRFVGMLTDSRSFLSFPRHEYFRRILCNILGSQIEKGQLPNDLEWIGTMAADISYHNAKNYFKF
jgi:glucuronate isomerase